MLLPKLDTHHMSLFRIPVLYQATFVQILKVFWGGNLNAFNVLRSALRFKSFHARCREMLTTVHDFH